MPHEEILKNGLSWLAMHEIRQAGGQSYCSTRDHFQARLGTLYQHLIKIKNFEVPLVVAAIGEIGNNCFDHNLGKWRDVPGCFFTNAYFENVLSVVIADRGQGIRASLSRVDSTIDTDQKAVNTAFSKKISGRSPEKRGNGLKFVRSVVNSSESKYLVCVSGSGTIELGSFADQKDKIQKQLLSTKIPKWGTIAALYWRYE